jgi:GNAT superfamily N-acetyltransferase
MIAFEHELRAPSCDEEWLAFHAIRREVLFESRGKDDYIENHPDDSKPGNHPMALVYRRDIIGVVRVDVCDTEAWLRRVAIRESVQRLGHGRILLRLAEAFAKDQGCWEVRTNAALEAVGFYLRCGYEQDNQRRAPGNSVSMKKSLH